METVIRRLKDNRYTWLITGVAGFIGSHLCAFLLRHGQRVIGLDNFSTGFPDNIHYLQSLEEAAESFTFQELDIRDGAALSQQGENVDFILHQAALGSVPRSIENPLTSHDVNVNGTLNIFDLYRKSPQIQRLVYASSSAVYGDAPESPKKEHQIGKPLSPYAATKCTNELYAHGYFNAYDRSFVGLRYFNVFGPRQSPQGAYAAVIPLWLQAIQENKTIEIFGDGETTRDFSYIDNVISANLLAALSEMPGSHVYNVACGHRISLKELAVFLNDFSGQKVPLHHQEFRAGDIPHSLADISKAEKELGYTPLVHVEEGLKRTVDAWFKQ